MPKKIPQRDPPLSVRFGTVPPGEQAGFGSDYALFMTGLDGKSTVARARESDREIFRTTYDQLRNDARRAAKLEQVQHHEEHVIGNCEESAEATLIKREFEQALKKDLKRVLATFDQADVARLVLARVLTGSCNWNDTKEIARKTGVSIRQVTTAKRKIDRRIKNNFPALRKHLGRASGI